MFGYFMGTTEEAGADTAAASALSDIPTFKSRDDVDYVAYGEESVRVLLARNSGDDGVTTWELVEESEESLIWRATVEGSEWSPFRVKMAVGASKQAIQTALLDTEVLLKLDEMTEQMVVLHTADAEGKVTLRHFTSKGMFPIAGREFVLVTYATDLPDGRVAIASRSIELDDVEPFEGYVRGRNIITGYLIEEKKDEDGSVYCEVTLLAHADLAGYIPASIVNMLGTSATVKVLANLKTHLEN
jgi:hypothetical protein